MRFFTLLKLAFLTTLGTVFFTSSDQSPSFSPACDTPSHEDYAPLMALYNATDGPNWTNNAGWGEECDVCGWYGVSCEQSRVTRVQLVNNGLVGSLAENVGDLEFLKILNLSNNSLSGSIPEALWWLQNLEEIQLSNNQFESPFPIFQIELANLSRLNLFDNKFYGPLPDNFHLIPNLKSLSISKNNFDGVIPPTLYGLSDLELLHLSGLAITGGLSEELGELRSLKNLQVLNTPIGGELPSSVGNLSELQYLYVSNAGISGSIPLTLYEISSLLSINLSNNSLSGSIAAQVGNLEDLLTLNLNNNDFVGNLPAALGNLEQLRNLSVQSNNLSGAIPNTLGEAINLSFLNLSQNDLIGEIPIKIGQLVRLSSLNLSRNNFSGEIPNSLYDLELLRFLNLSSCGLSGKIDSKIGQLLELSSLRLSGNSFSGAFPEEIGSLELITSINMSNNNFSSCFPNSYIKYCGNPNMIFDNNCTFENPTWTQFCAGEECSDGLVLNVNSAQVCEGDEIEIEMEASYTYSYEWSETNSTTRFLNTIASESKYYAVTITNSRGCTKSDSVYIEVASSSPGSTTASVCPGQPVTINDEEFSIPAVYEQTITRPGFCDSTLIITITEKSPTTGTYTETICPGSFTTINTEMLGQGEHMQTLTNQDGCDSILIITIDAYPTYEENLTFSVCEDENYDFNGTPLAPGLHILNPGTSQGCDSVLNIQVNETPATSATITASFCENGSVSVAGEEFLIPDTYERTITNVAGCDSILTIHITENEVSTTIINEVICEGSSFTVEDQEYSTPGPHTIPLLSAANCDSTVILSLTLISGDDQVINATICAGDSYPFAGNLYSEAITVTDSVFVNDCKSLATLTLTVVDPQPTEFYRTICEGENTFFDGNFYEEAISVDGTFQTAAGCDSTVTMHLSIAPDKHSSIDTFICEGSTIFFNGNPYTEATNFSILDKTQQGCDSTIYVSINMYENETDFFVEQVCQGGLVEFLDGETYGPGNHTGTYNDGNCIQNFELDVIGLANIPMNETLSICSGGNVEFMGETYSQGGTYHLGLQLENCEVVENLYILESSREGSFVPQVLCEGASVSWEGQEITSSGIYSATPLSACNEEVLDVVFISGDTISLERTIAAGESIEINNTAYTSAGTYEIEIGGDLGCPTILTLLLNVQRCGGERDIRVTLCEGESSDFYGQDIIATGTYEYDKPLEIGCDSIIRLIVQVQEEMDFAIAGPTFLCPGEEATLSAPAGYEYLWSDGSTSDHITITSGGSYELAIFDENECSSYASIEVEQFQFPSTSINIIKNDPATCDINNGNIIVDLLETQNYSYSIDDGMTWQKSNVFPDLGNGSYAIQLADPEQRCTKNFGIVVLESEGVPQIDQVEVTPINDCLSTKGSIIIIPAEIGVDYIYSIDGGENWSPEGVFIELEEGLYEPQLKAVGLDCVNNLEGNIDLKNIGLLEINITVESELSCSEATDGSAAVEIVNGAPPYEISWSDGVEGDIITGLSSGTYDVEVRDANGCIQEASITLEATDFAALLADIKDTLLCVTEPVDFLLDTSYNYIVFRNDILYYEGSKPILNDAGNYQIIVADGSECVSDASFIIDEVNLEDYGIDFLLATEGVAGIPVVAVNVSDPMPEDSYWDYDRALVDTEAVDRFSQRFIFRDTGTYRIQMLTEVRGCLTAYEKEITIYADSTELGSYEEPEVEIDRSALLRWAVFPNPNDGRFWVRVEVKSTLVPIRLSVYDINGGLRSETSKTNGNTRYSETFNLATASTGIYTVVLQVGNKQYYKNIMIIK